MQAAEEKEFRLVLSEFTKKQAAGFIRATDSIFFLSFSSTHSENRPFISMTCGFSICFHWNRTIVSSAAFAFAADLQAVPVDLAGYNPDCGLAVKADGDSLTARWKTPEGGTVLTLDVSGKGAFVQSIAVASSDAEPVVVLRRPSSNRALANFSSGILTTSSGFPKTVRYGFTESSANKERSDDCNITAPSKRYLIHTRAIFLKTMPRKSILKLLPCFGYPSAHRH